MKYKEVYTPFFIELEKVTSPYQFTHTKRGEIPDNDFREKELENIVNDPTVKDYCSKYKLDVTDFIALAKTSINYNFYKLQISENPNDLFNQELRDIIKKYKLSVPREYIKEYREEFNAHRESAKLLIDTKVAQRKYLELMKELLNKDPNLASQIIEEELNSLGFTLRIDVKKLIL